MFVFWKNEKRHSRQPILRGDGLGFANLRDREDNTYKLFRIHDVDGQWTVDREAAASEYMTLASFSAWDI